jgi:GGDEF domain-containing protein
VDLKSALLADMCIVTVIEIGAGGLCLPGRAEAETAIAGLMRRDRLGFVLAVLATDAPEIYEHHGYEAGDLALSALARRMAWRTAPGRELFRWSATSFVMVSRSLRKMTDSAAIEGATTALFAAWPNDRPRHLFDRIDHYIASHLACYEAA